MVPIMAMLRKTDRKRLSRRLDPGALIEHPVFRLVIEFEETVRTKEQESVSLVVPVAVGRWQVDHELHHLSANSVGRPSAE
jgi:hypothetical protein